MDKPDLKSSIAGRIAAKAPAGVWTPVDFLDLGSRDAVDKVLQRMARAGDLRRIDRGLYDKPRISGLTKRPTAPDYRQVIEALARRDQVRMLIDGITAANDLGLTNAVPARVVVHTDARRRSIKLDNLIIEFRLTAPSKLYWAGRPAMRIVQALSWLKDTLSSERDQVAKRLTAILADPTHGPVLQDDLRAGLKTLPAWMQRFVRDILDSVAGQPIQDASTADDDDDHDRNVHDRQNGDLPTQPRRQRARPAPTGSKRRPN
jgi:hypothetical protein